MPNAIKDPPRNDDSLLDPFLPEPRLVEVDHIDVAVPAAAAYAAFRHLDLGRSPLVRGLFWLRTLPDRFSGAADGKVDLRLDTITGTGAGAGTSPGSGPGPGPDGGFRLLHDEPDVGFAVGAIGRVWEPEIPFADVAPADFAAFSEPGWAKVAWSLRAAPLGPHGARVIVEVRVSATDDEAWRRTRRYFRLIGPFSRFIRHHLLSLLEKELGSPEAAEQDRPLPGDELLPEVKVQTTHGITIDATPERIWPWLVQMGRTRGGWYSYDLLDNGGEPSARELLPVDLHVGDLLPTDPEGKEGFYVHRMEPPRVLVLGGLYDMAQRRQLRPGEPRPERFWAATWAFYLEPLDTRSTRLIARARVDFAPGRLRWQALWMRGVHHLMEREQLRNLKGRAEGHSPPEAPENRPGAPLADVGEGIVGALGMALNFFTPFLRDRRSRWGVDEAVAARAYPGDERIPAPRWSWTHGVEIDAPADAVWPWVAQVGQDRAGLYSYQLLENLAGCEIHNADRVHPEWQARVGDGLRLHPKIPPLPIVALQPGRWFLVHGEIDPHTGQAPTPAQPQHYVQVTWLFFVEPLGPSRCRFISRYRVAYGDDLLAKVAYGPAIIEPVGFMMDRRMLLGVKERAERHAGARPATT